MDQFLPLDALIKLGVVFAVLAIIFALAISYDRRGGEWKYRAVVVLAIINTVLALTGCDEPINPVRFQPVEVLVTRPCMAGKAPPPEANTRINVTCTGKDCTLACSDPRPEECAKHMAADIAELQREAREARTLIKECSK